LEYEFDDDGKLAEDERSDLSEEAIYICNSCGEEIVVPLDYSAGQSQEYVEDCPVCCHPNIITVDFDENGQVEVWSRAE
jgi:rubrerythrin